MFLMLKEGQIYNPEEKSTSFTKILTRFAELSDIEIQSGYDFVCLVGNSLYSSLITKCTIDLYTFIYGKYWVGEGS